MNRTDPFSTVNILFVDDEPENYSSLKRHFTRLFEDLGCRIKMRYADTPESAYDEIDKRGTPYEVVVVDLLFPPVGSGSRFEARGIEVIERARQTSVSTVVVAITQGDLTIPDLEPTARDAGADIVLLRGHLNPVGRYGGPRRLVEDIYKFLCDRRLVEAGPELSSDDEPGVEMVLANTDVTGTTLRLLIADLLKNMEPRKAHISYVSPGGSGAQVIRARIDFVNGSRRTYLLKLDKNVDALKNELGNAEKAKGLYGMPSLVVPYLNASGPVTRNDWSAIGVVFAEGALRLRDWLSLPGSSTAVPALFSRLFLDGGLADGYASRLSGAGSPHPVQKLRLPAFRREKVRRAINLIEHSLDQVQPRLRPIPDLVRIVRGFVRNASIGDVHLVDVPAELHLVEAHGDLHGGNILVLPGEYPTPMIIDLASFDSHHWAADTARLATDLLLRGVDQKTEWFSWGRFGLWRDLCRFVGDLTPLSVVADQHNEGVFTALDWMIDRHRALLIHIEDPNHRWEWRVALAEQLLRGTYSRELSDPKRALALVAAYDQLMTVREEIPLGTSRF